MQYIEKLLDKALWPITIAIVGFVGKLFKKQKAHTNINLAIARKDIIGLFEKARDRGFTTLYEHEAMTELLMSYYTLGGNGTIHAIEAMYNQIPIETNPLDKKFKD